jgi:hypothetical protein
VWHPRVCYVFFHSLFQATSLPIRYEPSRRKEDSFSRD